MECGDVVSLPYFPNQEDKTQGTTRRVIILEVFNDSYSIVPMSCQVNQAKNYSKEFVIMEKSAEGIQMGLTCDSLVICDREIALPKSIFKFKLEKLGTCPDEIIDKIHECLAN